VAFHASVLSNPINLFIQWSNAADWLSPGGQFGALQSTDATGTALWTFTAPISPVSLKTRHKKRARSTLR